MLSVEGMLMDDLRAKGHRLYMEPAAKAYHVNVSLLWSWIKHCFLGGRLFGAARVEKKKWSLWRRLLYILGAPLIPLVRIRRALRTIQRTDRRRELLPRILPALISGLIPHAFGELTGYALGRGGTEYYYGQYEMRRVQHLNAKDREAESAHSAFLTAES
jgi:hypothetical protein